jgi:cytochrome P450
VISYPQLRPSPFEPPAIFKSLRDTTPVGLVELYDGRTSWLLTRHQDIRDAYADTRLSSVPTHPGYPHTSASLKAKRLNSQTFLLEDAPEHDVHRRMVAPSFSVKRIQAMRPAVQDIVDNALETMLTSPQPCDLIKTFALPIPSLVICTLLGVPYADHDLFQELSLVSFQNNASPDVVVKAIEDLNDYLRRLISIKEASPADDLLSDLVTQQLANGLMTRDEVVLMAQLMLLAGHETTANTIGLSVLALLNEPEQLAALRADPALIPGAVEEILRYTSIAQFGSTRVALEDLELGGQVIQAGEGVILPPLAGNWDETVFPGPEKLNIRRSARNHLAFGYGRHACLGQPLARMELETVFASLFLGLPTLALAATADDIRFKYDSSFFGIYELPVTW